MCSIFILQILTFVPVLHQIEVEVAIRSSLEVYENDTNGELHSVSDLSRPLAMNL